MRSIVVIPARLASTRLPDKPLVMIAGKTLIQRTYEQCLKAVKRSELFIATESHKIREHCESFGASVIMTSSSCLTGTDRVAEVAKELEVDFYINVQGDEPLVSPMDIVAIRDAAVRFPGEVINGYASVTTEDDYRSITIPKVVFRPDGRLLYMSRSPLPANKNSRFNLAYRQICIYAFPRKSLLEFAANSDKTLLEGEEDIEILRFLEMGMEVRMIPLSGSSIAVDTLGDIDRVVRLLTA